MLVQMVSCRLVQVSVSDRESGGRRRCQSPGGERREVEKSRMAFAEMVKKQQREVGDCG